ncbi:MAG: methylase [Methanomicrobiales archaeon]|jgi:release factor glutamine methyltransferase|nr:methylase [Methanomicrobiales archaeon]
MQRLQTNSYELELDSNQVYQPAEDSWLLLHAAKKEANATDTILEIGVGSGVIAEQFLQTHFIVGTDMNPHAAQTTYRKGVPVLRADLFFGICARFDLILFNPPYLPTKSEERVNDWLEYALDGGEDGCDTIERFFAQAESYLTKKGRILVLLSSLNPKERIHDIFMRYGWSFSCIAEEIVEGERLYVLQCVPQMRCVM